MPCKTDLLGQAWKEYSKSDSRYLTADPTVVIVESITAWAWGPLCLLTAYLILSHSPFRHPTQTLTSGGQFYGVVLYYLTNIMDYHYSGISYSRPEGFYYYAYFVSLNAPWAIIPVCQFFKCLSLATE
jgi:cholestenol Delta-isomerase